MEEVQKSVTNRTIDYHKVGDINDRWLSNSIMDLLLPQYGGSHSRYRQYLEGRLEKKKQTPSLGLGTLVHLWHQDRDSFVVLNTDLPSGKIGEVCQWLNMVYGTQEEYTDSAIHDACKAIGYGLTWKDKTRLDKIIEASTDYWKEKFQAVDKLSVTAKQREQLERMVNSMLDSSEIRSLLGFGESEIPIYQNFAGVNCKILVDRLIDDEHFIDLKTTSDPLHQFMGYTVWTPDKDLTKPIKRGVSGAFQRYKYYRQIAFYRMILQEHYKLSNRPHAYIVVVQSVEPFETMVIAFSNNDLGYNLEWLKVGKQEALQAIEEAKRFDEGLWE